MKKLFALVAVALTLCGLLTACGSKTETANDVDLTGFYNALAEKYGWGDDMMDLDGEMLEMYYPGLGDIAAKQFLAKAPVMSYAVSEYVFLQADSEQDAAQAVKILQTRIDSQADGDASYPETIDQWKRRQGAAKRRLCGNDRLRRAPDGDRGRLERTVWRVTV